MRRIRMLSALVVIAGTLFGIFPVGAALAGPAPLIIVVMENHGYSGVIGNPNMPYFNQLWSEGIAGTGSVIDYQQMYAVTHPSLPNYLAIASGSTQGQAGTDTATAGEFNAQSVWDQLTAADISWRVYEEGMPAVCSRVACYNDTAAGGTDGQYVLRHNPATPFAPVYTSAECQQVQPLSALNLTALPGVSFVTPNVCNDDHGIPSGTYDPYQNCVQDSTALVQRGDNWLQAHVSAWTAAGADVLVTWDEGTGSAGVNGTSGGGRIATVLTGPGVTPGQDSTQYSHYSVLAGVEDRYGLPLLAGAATANPVPLPGASVPAVSVSISQPASNSTVSGTVTVSGTAAATAGVAQVQVSVDNGTPHVANGTTNWTASINTTTLANGSHTISAQATDANGNTATAAVTVTVSNGISTSCPATSPGATELSANLSLESSQTGWTGIYNANSNVGRVEPSGGSYDGLWALQVTVRAGAGAAGVNNANPLWVPGPPGTATAVGQVFTGSAFVQASTPGEQISLLLRETTPSGNGIGYHTTTVTLGDTGWHQITSSYTAAGNGDLIRYSLYAANLASASQYFLADCLSLQTP